jgi:hypothetical protein
MTSAELAKLFFPNTRKEILVQGISLLQSAEGEKRVRLELVMPFGDGKVIGMPSYIGDVYDHIAKAETVERFSKLDLDFEAMSLFIYSTEDHDKTAQILYNAHMTGFTMTREKQKEGAEELSEVFLKFVVLAPSNPKLWSWLYPYHRGTMFVRFEPTQSDVDDIQAAKPDTQMKLGDDGYEAARKDETSKERDAEFAGKAN